MPYIIPPSISPARNLRAPHQRARRWAALAAGLLAVVVAVPATAAVPDPGVVVSPAAKASLTGDLKVGVYPDSSTWTNNGITSLYLDPDRAGSQFPVKNAEALLAKGISLDITLHPKGTNYIAGIVNNSTDAMNWINSYIANIKTISNYASNLNNGTYVVATLMHESQVQVRDGKVTGASANYTTIGKAQQITIRLGKQNAPNAYWSVWIVGYDRTDEGTQLAQITNPKPDLITWDPYSNANCNDTLSDIAAQDLAWVKAQPAYNGSFALSETGISNKCTDAQMATFYTGLPAKMRALDAAFRFLTVFNSDSGPQNHTLTGKTKAIAALKASLTR